MLRSRQSWTAKKSTGLVAEKHPLGDHTSLLLEMAGMGKDISILLGTAGNQDINKVRQDLSAAVRQETWFCGKEEFNHEGQTAKMLPEAQQQGAVPQRKVWLLEKYELCFLLHTELSPFVRIGSSFFKLYY